jgi:hypothetical protein
MSESTAREVWRAVLGDLQLQLPRPTFETWLKPTEGVAYDDHVFVVEAPILSLWSGWNAGSITHSKKRSKRCRGGNSSSD